MFGLLRRGTLQDPWNMHVNPGQKHGSGMLAVFACYKRLLVFALVRQKQSGCMCQLTKSMSSSGHKEENPPLSRWLRSELAILALLIARS
jgi:hypothetical protein